MGRVEDDVHVAEGLSFGDDGARHDQSDRARTRAPALAVDPAFSPSCQGRAPRRCEHGAVEYFERVIREVERVGNIPGERRTGRLNENFENAQRDARRSVDDPAHAFVPPPGIERRADTVERRRAFALPRNSKQPHLAEDTVANASEQILDFARGRIRVELVERPSAVECSVWRLHPALSLFP